MQKEIQVCVDRVLPREVLIPVAEMAVRENIVNAPVAPRGLGLARPTRQELAGLTGKKWQNGRTLRVRFLDGEPTVQAKVEQIAHEWSRYANVKFTFGSDFDAEIRISFLERGSWSYIGTDALAKARNEATMNFGWLGPNTPDDEYRRVVLHEFGHALFCIHEHQSPAENIPWDKEAVYAYYAGPPNFWSRETVDANLFEKYDATLTQFTKFDRKSIMLYPIPNEFTVGDFEVGLNGELSTTDKEFIGTRYPMAAKPVGELTVNAPPVPGSIDQAGEEDDFQFVAVNQGRYRIETEGPTDVVMVLYGPDDPTAKLVEDDDSGRNWNARIVARLRAGRYRVRIRHYQPEGTGKYSVSVRTLK